MSNHIQAGSAKNFFAIFVGMLLSEVVHASDHADAALQARAIHGDDCRVLTYHSFNSSSDTSHWLAFDCHGDNAIPSDLTETDRSEIEDFWADWMDEDDYWSSLAADSRNY